MDPDVGANLQTSSNPKAPRRRGSRRFKNLTDVTREMNRIYTEGRAGLIDLADMTRLINALTNISNTLSKQRELDLEKRLVKLEEGT